MIGKIKLTAEVEQQILASIRAGGYAHVAAAAWGVPEQLWEKWRQSGTRKGGRQPYRDLFVKVEQAQAQARLKAEMAALEADPRCWLKHGPGKERPANPGWAAMAKPAPAPDSAHELFSLQALLQFVSKMRTVLTPYPDAHAAFAQLLEESDLLTSATGKEDESELSWTDMAWRSQPTFRTNPPSGTMQEPDETLENDA